MDIYKYIMYQNLIDNEQQTQRNNEQQTQQINIDSKNEQQTFANTKKIKTIHIENATIRPYYHRWRQHTTRRVQSVGNEYSRDDDEEIIEI